MFETASTGLGDAAGSPHVWDRPTHSDAAVAALTAAIDVLAAANPADLPATVALARTRALLVQLQRLEATTIRAVGDVDARRLHTCEASPSTSEWVKAQAVAGLGAEQVTLARRLRRLPTVEAELLAGRLSSTAAAAVGKAVAKAARHLDQPDGLIDGMPAEPALYGVLVDGVCSLLAEQTGGTTDDDPEQELLRARLEQIDDPTRSERDRVEAALTVFAQLCNPALLPSGLSLLLDALLPNEHQKRADLAEDDAGFDLHRKHGGSGWTCRGDLDDLTGELLATVLDAAAATDPAKPADTDAWRAARETAGDDSLTPADWPAGQIRPRSRRRQRHDALARGLAALLDSGALGTRGKAAPHVGVTVDLDFLQGVPGTLPGRTTHGARIARRQLRDLLCRSTFTRLVRDARRRVVEVSHTQRTATALERLLLHAQWGGTCARRRCGRGPATGHRLVPHHGELFSVTGTTSLEDTVPLCEVDHDHYLHGQGLELELEDGRILGPSGWVRRERRRP